jgi:hypothetical protein
MKWRKPKNIDEYQLYFYQIYSDPPFVGFQSLELPFYYVARCYVPLSHNPFHFLCTLYFGSYSSSSSSSSRWPGHYSLRRSVTIHAYYMPIPFQHIAVHSFQNSILCATRIFLWLLNYFLTFITLVVLADLLQKFISVLNSFFFNL